MEKIVSYSPITLEAVGSVDITLKDDLETMIERCRDAQRKWMTFSKDDKLRCISNLNRTVIERTEDIVRTIYLETGKPKADALATEVMSSAAMTKYCEYWLKRWTPVKKVKDGPFSLMMTFLGRKSCIEYRPLGVIGAIESYNFPFTKPFTEALAAVTAGNGVILKPSEQVPLSCKLVEDLFKDAGFPEDLVITVCGRGIGEALTLSSVDKILFTGSSVTGRTIMNNLSKTLKPSIMELGGKDAMIVLNDADVERAVSCAVWGSFVNAGQVCTGIKRIYVHNSILNEFTELMINDVKNLRMGDGWDDPEISVGPLINDTAVRNIEGLIEKMTSCGCEILIGGKRASDLKGHFFEPTVVSGKNMPQELVDTEAFGPVVTIFGFDTEEDAVKMANSTPFALGGSVWSKNTEKAHRIATMLKPCTIVINNASYTYGIPSTPWMGRDESGYGATHGESGFIELMCAHHIHTDRGKHKRDPWWMPYNKNRTEVLKETSNTFFGGKNLSIDYIRNILAVLKGKK